MSRKWSNVWIERYARKTKKLVENSNFVIVHYLSDPNVTYVVDVVVMITIRFSLPVGNRKFERNSTKSFLRNFHWIQYSVFRENLISKFPQESWYNHSMQEIGSCVRLICIMIQLVLKNWDKSVYFHIMYLTLKEMIQYHRKFNVSI